MRTLDHSTIPARSHPGDGIGRAHAKAILFGEHTVLYGAPALTVPVTELPVQVRTRRGQGPLRITTVPPDEFGGPDGLAVPRTAVSTVCTHLGISAAGFALHIDSAVPSARGLGSSAAVAAAVISSVAAACGHELTDDIRFSLVQACETVAHGRSSGIDAHTVLATGAPLWFEGGTVRRLPVHPAFAATGLVIVDSGIRGRTLDAVALVRRRLDALGPVGAELLARSRGIHAAAAADLASGRIAEFGARMTESHSVLAKLEVSCPPLDRMVTTAVAAGACGAKLSGSGLGGCVIALTPDSSVASAVVAALTSAGARHRATVRWGQS